jgi:hypothetical protein
LHVELRHLAAALSVSLAVSACGDVSAVDVAPATRDVWKPGLPVTLNQDLIDGLYANLDLEDPLIVFAALFRSLPAEVTVYPSEGYYYFSFPCRGMIVRGSILLDVVGRDQGRLDFGYVGEIEDHPGEKYLPMPGRSVELGPSEGLLLEKLDPWQYSATFEGRTVRFKLYDPGHEPPPSMLSSERYVGTAMDESGLRFHLLYDESLRFLFWMLDEDRFCPENLLLMNDRLCRGARTHFVFLRDAEVDRKLLLGVHRTESSYNSWYDGPFDQLPDTRIAMGLIDLKPMLAAYSGLSPEAMDDHGRLFHEPGARIPVASYRLYDTLAEFDEVPTLAAEGLSATAILERLTRRDD